MQAGYEDDLNSRPTRRRFVDNSPTPPTRANSAGSGKLAPVTALVAVVLGLFGLTFGSFANVVIHRVPRRESVVRPASRCPACGTPIAGRDNIPVVSWLLLRGHCRACAAPISPRYPLVEAVTGAGFAIAALLFDAWPWRVAGCAVVFAVVIGVGLAWDSAHGERSR
jgi:prepilin signal peptidase PulO-like enzyme (type II secretory pathway)